MDKLQCTNCGGIINPRTLISEYCGTRYKESKGEPDVLTIHVDRPDIRVLQSRVRLGFEAVHVMGEEAAIAKCKERIASDMAEKLMPLIEIQSEYVPWEMSTVVNARLRVVDPKFKF